MIHWRLIAFRALPEGIEYEVQAPNGIRRQLYITAGELAIHGRKRSPLRDDGKPRKIAGEGSELQRAGETTE